MDLFFIDDEGIPEEDQNIRPKRCLLEKIIERIKAFWIEHKGYKNLEQDQFFYKRPFPVSKPFRCMQLSSVKYPRK